MNLEDEIKSKGFSSEYEKLEVNLIYTYNWARDTKSKYFKDFDVTAQQYNVLRILRGRFPKPYSTSEIRDRMLDKMSDASRIVDRLFAKGYLDRKSCEKDRRLVDVVINKKGLGLLKEMDERIQASAKEFQNLSGDEVSNLNELLDKLRG